MASEEKAKLCIEVAEREESFVNKESMCNFAPQFDYRKILITTYLIIKNNDCSTSKRRRKH